jgi:hypothetical protein
VGDRRKQGAICGLCEWGYNAGSEGHCGGGGWEGRRREGRGREGKGRGREGKGRGCVEVEVEVRGGCGSVTVRLMVD